MAAAHPRHSLYLAARNGHLNPALSNAPRRAAAGWLGGLCLPEQLGSPLGSACSLQRRLQHGHQRWRSSSNSHRAMQQQQQQHPLPRSSLPEL